MTTTVDTCEFRIVSPQYPTWDAYVERHTKGSIFHTSAMIDVFRRTRGLEPHAYAATDADGNIVAMLVSCHVKTLNQLAAMSSRAVQYAEPLCNSDPVGIAALTQLVRKADQGLRMRALFSEVRSICEPGPEKEVLERCGYQHRDFINYVVDLQQGREQLWKSLHKRMRQKIRSTLRRGIVLRDDNTREGVTRLYSLLQASYGKAHIPLADRELFLNTLERLPAEQVRIRTAFKDDEPVASIISLIFRDRVFSWYGGTLRLNGISPFACIVWDDMAWAAENGYAFYDFGGAGWASKDYGPRRFKAQFGGEEVCYGRYWMPYSQVRLSIAEWAYGVSRLLGVWSHAKRG